MKDPEILTEMDLNWTVDILYGDPYLVQNKQILFHTLGLGHSELEDLRQKLRLLDAGSREFLWETLMKWISKEGRKATFQELLKHLGQCSFNSVAEKISEKLKTDLTDGNNATCYPNPFCFQIPQRVSSFTGRELELQTLHSAILSQKNGGRGLITTVLSGLGGVGKTALAIEYVWTYSAKFFQSLIWLNSEEKSSLTHCLGKLAKQLRIVDTGLSLQRIVTLIYETLISDATYGNTLIVFDNVESYKEVRPYLPILTPGNKTQVPYILLTSRNKNWSDRVDVIHLDVFKQEESVGFLKKYLNLETVEEIKLAGDVAEALQNLPLGIRQAGAYIKVNYNSVGGSMSVRLREYIHEFMLERETALLKFKHWKVTDDEYEKTVYVTWNVTFKKIRGRSRLAGKIMKLVAYLNPDNIHVRLFDHLDTKSKKISNSSPACIRHLPFLRNKFSDETVVEAIELLDSYSIINRDNARGTFSVHRLLQKVIKLQTEKKFPNNVKLQKAVCLIILALADNNYNEEESEPAYLCYIFDNLTHAQFLVSHMDASAHNLLDTSIELAHLIINKQDKLINRQLDKLIGVCGREDYDSAIRLFFQFDQAVLQSKLNSGETLKNLYYIKKYYYGFIEIVLSQVIFKCETEEPDLKVFIDVERKMDSIFTKGCNSSVVVCFAPFAIAKLISHLLSCMSASQVERTQCELIQLILVICQNAIRYRRKYYIQIIGAFDNGMRILNFLIDLKLLNGITQFLHGINQVLTPYECDTEVNGSFFESGLMNSLSNCQVRLLNLKEQSVIVELFHLYEHLYKITYFRQTRIPQNDLDIINMAHEILTCLMVLKQFDCILQFLEMLCGVTTKYEDEAVGKPMESWFRDEHCELIAYLLEVLSECAECSQSLKIQLLNRILKLYKTTSCNYSYQSAGIRVSLIISCLVQTNNLSEFLILVKESGIVFIELRSSEGKRECLPGNGTTFEKMRQDFVFEKCLDVDGVIFS